MSCKLTAIQLSAGGDGYTNFGSAPAVRCGGGKSGWKRKEARLGAGLRGDGSRMRLETDADSDWNVSGAIAVGRIEVGAGVGVQDGDWAGVGDARARLVEHHHIARLDVEPLIREPGELPGQADSAVHPERVAGVMVDDLICRVLIASVVKVAVLAG